MIHDDLILLLSFLRSDCGLVTSTRANSKNPDGIEAKMMWSCWSLAIKNQQVTFGKPQRKLCLGAVQRDSTTRVTEQSADMTFSKKNNTLFYQNFLKLKPLCQASVYEFVEGVGQPKITKKMQSPRPSAFLRAWELWMFGGTLWWWSTTTMTKPWKKDGKNSMCRGWVFRWAFKIIFDWQQALSTWRCMVRPFLNDIGILLSTSLEVLGRRCAQCIKRVGRRTDSFKFVTVLHAIYFIYLIVLTSSHVWTRFTLAGQQFRFLKLPKTTFREHSSCQSWYWSGGISLTVLHVPQNSRLKIATSINFLSPEACHLIRLYTYVTYVTDVQIWHIHIYIYTHTLIYTYIMYLFKMISTPPISMSWYFQLGEAVFSSSHWILPPVTGRLPQGFSCKCLDCKC